MSQFFISCKESRIESPRSFYSSFFLGPFDPGESLTVANALRRTLLSELGGIAIISVEIEGASHEYSNLPGVRDTVLDILLNIKDIVLKKLSKNMKPQLGYLRVRGPGIIRAKDLRLPPFIQCVDPDQYIATLAEDGILNIKFIIDEGKNYIKGKPKTFIDINQFKKRRLILKKLNQICNNSSLLNNYYFYLNKKYKSNFENRNSSFDPRSDLFLNRDEKNLIISKKKKSSFSKNITITKTLSSPLRLLNIDAVFNPINKVNYIIEPNEHKIIESISTQSRLVETMYQTINASLNSQFNPINIKKENLDFELKITKIKPLLSISAQRCLENLTNYQLNLIRIKNLSLKKILKFTNLINFSVKTTDAEPADCGCKASPGGATEINLLTNENKNKNMIISLPEHKVKKFKLKEKKILSLKKEKNGSLKIKNKNFNQIKINKKNLENISDIIDLKTESMLDLINPRVNSKGHDVLISDGKKNVFKHNILLEIWTNGSLHPREALYQAFKHLIKLFSKLNNLKIITKLFESNRNYKDLIRKIKNENFELFPVNENVFIGKYGGIKAQLNKLDIQSINSKTLKLKNLNNNSVKKKLFFTSDCGCEASPVVTKKKISKDHFDLIDIGTLNISLRTYSSLKRSNINTLTDLLTKSKKELLKFPNFGKNSLFEIEKSLSQVGLNLK